MDGCYCFKKFKEAKLGLEQNTKAQRRSSDMSILFL